MIGLKFVISTDENGKIQVRTEGTTATGKTREFKGTSANKHVDDYCILDLETTGVFINSAKIIEISAVKVRNNEVVDKYSTLVNPQCPIPAAATAVNHITDDMVKDAPVLDDVIDNFLVFVGNDVILGYNNASFDMNLIYDTVLQLRGKIFSNDYLDMLHAVKRSLPELANSKLETVSKHYGFDIDGEHRALKDCYLTKSCYDKLYEEFGDTAFRKSSHHSSGKGVQHSVETIALQELHKLLEGMLEDGEITMEEIDLLRYWLEEHRDLSGNYPFDKVFYALDNVLEDGVITQKELSDLKTIFKEIIDPVKAQGCHDQIKTLKGKHVCLTGEFAYGSKNEIEKLIEDAGGINDKNVKKATNYVVVGAHGSDAWKTGNYGGKIQKAMEWNAKGMSIKIIEEVEFISAVQYIIEHPNECACKTEIATYDWKTTVQHMLDELVIEEELPAQSLYLMANYSKNGRKITSYSICIYEPDYPLSPNTKKDSTRNSIVLNIKENGTNLELMIGKTCFEEIGVPEGADVKEIKSDKLYMHVIFPADHSELVNYIKKNTKYACTNYSSKASSFGCCSRFNDCSDAKKCIHVNKLYSKACIYRQNLEAGKIYYGKNRNID